MANGKGRNSGVRIALIGCALGILAAALAIGAGLGNRFYLWTFREGFAALGWIAYVGAGAAAISALGVVLAWKQGRGALIMALIGLVLGAAVAWIPYQGQSTLPDVTTDTANPPVFVAAPEIRKKTRARTSTDYTAEKAATQAKSYPDIKPVIVMVSPDVAFDKALAVVKAMGLEIIAADKPALRIEAADTTFWFGFKDDVVIRITPAPEGAPVDIRSTSRVGGRDGGTNAARVRNITAKIAAN